MVQNPLKTLGPYRHPARIHLVLVVLPAATQWFIVPLLAPPLRELSKLELMMEIENGGHNLKLYR